MDGAALHVPVHGIEGGAAQLAAVVQVKVSVIFLNVGKPREPGRPLGATQLAHVHFLNDLRGLVGERLGRGQLVKRLGHHGGDQVIPQAAVMLRPALLGHPLQKAAAVPVLAMAVVTAERPRDGQIARLGVAVAMLRCIRADDAAPALGVRARQDAALARQPRQDIISARVGQADGADGGAVGLGRRYAQRLTYGLQRKFALGVELNQSGDKAALLGLQVHAAGDAEVTHGVDRAGVGVARVSNGVDCGAVFVLSGLLGKHVAVLEVVWRGLHDPRRFNRRHFGLGAYVVEDQADDVLAVDGGRRRATVFKPIQNKTSCVYIQGVVGLERMGRQVRRPGVFRLAIKVAYRLAVSDDRLLADNQNGLALVCQLAQKLNK